MAGSTDEHQALSSAKRVTDVLFAITESELPISVRAIAEATSNSRSSVHRILLKLAEEGYAELRGDGGYSAGPKLVELGARTFGVVPVLRFADELMRQMVKDLGETCYLATFDRDSLFATFIHRVESNNPVRHIQPLGRRLPLHAGAVGKAMLVGAQVDLGDLNLESFTPGTHTDLDALRKDLEQIRERGFAVSYAERVEDVVGIAAPVTSGETVVGGLTTAIPGSRFSEADLDEIAAIVMRYAKTLSESLSAMGVRRL